MKFHKDQLEELRQGLLLRKWENQRFIQMNQYKSEEELAHATQALNTDVTLLEYIDGWIKNLEVPAYRDKSQKSKDSFNRLFNDE